MRATSPDGVFHRSPEISEAATEPLKEEEAFMAAGALLEGQVDHDAGVRAPGPSTRRWRCSMPAPTDDATRRDATRPRRGEGLG
ncbi:hypothetical protein D7Y13_44540, partial [Corallococcus praedator]